MTLNDLDSVLKIPGVTFVDLQYGDTVEERNGIDIKTAKGMDMINADDLAMRSSADMFHRFDNFNDRSVLPRFAQQCAAFAVFFLLYC